MIQLVIFALAVTGALAQYDCSNVNCAAYVATITPHDNGFFECRFKTRSDNLDLNNKFHSGLQIHRYKDVSQAYGEDPANQKPTQDCPAPFQYKVGKLRMTESPRLSDDKSIFGGSNNYKNCCVPKVLNYCYYKVVAFFNCGEWSPLPSDPKNNDRTDDIHIRTEVHYKNRAADKSVYVSFYPLLGKVTCSNDFNDNEHTLYFGNGSSQKKECGDSDNFVVLKRYKVFQAGDNSPKPITVLKTLRYQCASQYVAMFQDDVSHPERVKTTMRTDVDGRDDHVGGARIAPVLAATFSGACKKLVKSVTVV